MSLKKIYDDLVWYRIHISKFGIAKDSFTFPVICPYTLSPVFLTYNSGVARSWDSNANVDLVSFQHRNDEIQHAPTISSMPGGSCWSTCSREHLSLSFVFVFRWRWFASFCSVVLNQIQHLIVTCFKTKDIHIIHKIRDTLFIK